MTKSTTSLECLTNAFNKIQLYRKHACILSLSISLRRVRDSAITLAEAETVRIPPLCGDGLLLRGDAWHLTKDGEPPPPPPPPGVWEVG